MKFLIIFGVTVCSSLLISHGSNVENCEECSKYFDDIMGENGDLRKKIIDMEPFKIKGIGVCGDCVFTGVHDFKRIETKQICVTKTDSGEIRRHMSVQFNNVTGICNCDLNSDSFMKSVSTSKLKHCISKLGNGYQGISLKEDDIDKLHQCFPTFSKLLLYKSEVDQFRVGANWQNAQFTFDLVSKPGQMVPVIENTHVLQNDTNGFTTMCDGSDLISEVCKCMTEGNYMGHNFMQWMKVGLSCGLEITGQFAIPEVLTDMACPV